VSSCFSGKIFHELGAGDSTLFTNPSPKSDGSIGDYFSYLKCALNLHGRGRYIYQGEIAFLYARTNASQFDSLRAVKNHVGIAWPDGNKKSPGFHDD
jgi:hypothetical protein